MTWGVAERAGARVGHMAEDSPQVARDASVTVHMSGGVTRSASSSHRVNGIALILCCTTYHEESQMNVSTAHLLARHEVTGVQTGGIVFNEFSRSHATIGAYNGFLCPPSALPFRVW